jgi:hypothetical protein
MYGGLGASYNKALPSPFPIAKAEEIPSCCHDIYIPIRLPQRPVVSLANGAGPIARYENNAVPALFDSALDVEIFEVEK